MWTPAEVIDGLLRALGGASTLTVAAAQNAMRIFFDSLQDQIIRNCYLNQERLRACHEIVPRHLLAQPVDQDFLDGATQYSDVPYGVATYYLLGAMQAQVNSAGLHSLAVEAHMLRILQDTRAVVDVLLATAVSPTPAVQHARSALTIGYLPPVPPITPRVEADFAQAAQYLITPLRTSIISLPLDLVVKILSLVALSTSARELLSVLHAFPHWAEAANRLTQVTLTTHAARRNAQAWVLQHRTPHLLNLALGHPLSNVAAPRTTALHLLRLVVNMAQRTRWKRLPTETTLAALGDARIQNITFYNTRQLMLHRYFRNEQDPPAHVFLSASSATLSAAVILQSGRICKFFDLDGGADVVLSRHVLGVVHSLALSDALPASTSLKALFKYPAPELRSLEITMNASDSAPAHTRLMAYRGPGWEVCPKLKRLSLRAPQTREVNAAEVNAFMVAICGRTLELKCVNVVLV